MSWPVDKLNILVSICARKGSKGLPSKNIRPLLGKPLITHTIKQARDWNAEKYGTKKIVVSTDGEDIAAIAKEAGAEVPFLRPDFLANDSAGKIPVLTHLLLECEKKYGQVYDLVLDLDPTAPVRTSTDIDKGISTFLKSQADVCFSVTKARKNPYFNMVERKPDNTIRLVMDQQASGIVARQSAPDVWDANASIYVYKPAFLRKAPAFFWDAKAEIFEMPPESAFDIDTERDFLIVETLFRELQKRNRAE